MQTTGVITVRYNSSRLPGKALKEIAGKPMLQHTYEMACCANLDKVVVATTASSQPIIVFCNGMNWPIFYDKGLNEDDLLSRMIHAVGSEHQIIVRIWGDNPFPFPWLINRSLEYFKGHPEMTYVVGHSGDSFCSVVDSEVLNRIGKQIVDIKIRNDIHLWMQEHLTSCILNYPGMGAKLTVDSQEDLDRVRAFCAKGELCEANR